MSITLIVLVGLLVIIGGWVMGTYNGFVVARNKADEAESTMDVYLKKRYDLIPNIVETVKGYAKHEQETFEKVISARAKAISSTSTEEKVEAEKELSGALGRLLAITEAYPDLKANVNFMDLQKELKVMEGEIANSRKYYNTIAMDYNNKIQIFPGNLLAGMFGFGKRPLYAVSDESERENVKVAF